MADEPISSVTADVGMMTQKVPPSRRRVLALCRSVLNGNEVV